MSTKLYRHGRLYACNMSRREVLDQCCPNHIHSRDNTNYDIDRRAAETNTFSFQKKIVQDISLICSGDIINMFIGSSIIYLLQSYRYQH